MYISSIIAQRLAYERSAELRRQAEHSRLVRLVRSADKPGQPRAERRHLPAPRWRRVVAPQGA